MCRHSRDPSARHSFGVSEREDSGSSTGDCFKAEPGEVEFVDEGTVGGGDTTVRWQPVAAGRHINRYATDNSRRPILRGPFVKSWFLWFHPPEIVPVFWNFNRHLSSCQRVLYDGAWRAKNRLFQWRWKCETVSFK